MDGTGSTEHDPYTRVTVAEAAASLGVSVVTIRRMIRRGQLEGERVLRPQGSTYLVKLPVDESADATPTEQGAQDVSRANATAQPAPAEAIAAMIQATLTPIIAPLVGQLDAQRQTVERQADQLVTQAETIGRQSERVAGLEAEVGRLLSEMRAAQQAKSTLEARTAPLSVETTTGAVSGVPAPSLALDRRPGRLRRAHRRAAGVAAMRADSTQELMIAIAAVAGAALAILVWWWGRRR
jgi:excisionase family DNA binding protein